MRQTKRRQSGGALRGALSGVSLWAGVLLASGCGPGELDAEESARFSSEEGELKAAVAVAVDPRRSLAVTEQVILQRFGFKRVLDQLVAQSGVPGLTSLQLFNQWWDTQNPGPGLGRGPHCDDLRDAAGAPIINGYPYTCRATPSEGAQATSNPFAAGQNGAANPDAYIPVGLTNRFDLAPADGSNCGEYRIVYAKQSGADVTDNRNLIIFEAALPNRHPQQGIKGCRKVAELWAGLSSVADPVKRADALESFYFNGLSPFPPVIHVDHFGNGADGEGQVRTNQFMVTTPRIWSLREFKLRKRTVNGAARLQFEPATVKVNPFGPLFVQTSAAHARTGDFRQALVAQVAELAVNDLNGFNHDLSDAFNTAQAQASGSTENNYAVQFGTAGGPLSQSLQSALTAAGSTLTPEQIVLRVQALSCAGCHRLNNNVAIGGGLVFPPSQGFTHISERLTEDSPDGPRFQVSAAMTDVFLPQRKAVLEDFVNKDKVKKTKRPKDPIGGRKPH